MIWYSYLMSTNKIEVVSAIDQTQKLETLQDSYVFASTRQIVDAFEAKGWKMVSSNQTKVRKQTKEGFQRHLVKFESDVFPSIPGLSSNNASKPQIVVVNAHDGTAALRMMTGIFRMACSNGIITGTSLRDFRACHSNGRLGDKINEGIEAITDGMPLLIEQVQKLQNSRFSPTNLDILVKGLVDERLAAADPVSVDYDSALAARRFQDKNEDAFTVFNRLQESLIKGGIRYQATVKQRNENGDVVAESIVNRVTRRMNSIQASVRLNRMAYDLAVKLAE